MKKLFLLTVLLWSCGNSEQPTQQQPPMVLSTPSEGSAVAQWKDRAALVIGNSAYKYVNPLLSPKKDAEDMTATLKSIGFGQVSSLINGSKEKMLDALTAFARAAKQKSVVVYYSGHGVQLEHENYLVPVDAPNPQTATEARLSCVSLNDVLSVLHESGCRPKILILDACRNNPFKSLAGNKAVGGKGGLAKPESKFSETYLAFATTPGETAPDGNGAHENSPYTQVLLAELRTPNVQIEQTFKKVRARLEPSGQTPWENSSLKGDFVFFPQKVAATAPPVEVSSVSAEETDFAAVKNIPQAKVFLTQYPSGKFAPTMRQQLADWQQKVTEHLQAAEAYRVADMQTEAKEALRQAQLLDPNLK